MADPNPPASRPESQEAHNELVLSYVAVRQALGYLGYFLPFALIVYAALPGNRLEPSISDFYYTGMGGILTGTLSAIGIFLISYRGYDPEPGERLSDRWLARIAGASALGVALLPVHRTGYPICLSGEDFCWIFGLTRYPVALHYSAAGIFLVCLALFSLIQFPRGERDSRGRLQWTRRTYVFLISGSTILAMIVSIIPYFLADESSRAVMSENHYLFWCETIAILAFATAWLTKGRALRTLRQTIGL